MCLGGYAVSPFNSLDATKFHLELGCFLLTLILHRRYFFAFCKQTVKITLVGAVLDQSVFFKLAFNKGFCNLMGDPTRVVQNLIPL